MMLKVCACVCVVPSCKLARQLLIMLYQNYIFVLNSISLLYPNTFTSQKKKKVSFFFFYLLLIYFSVIQRRVQGCVEATGRGNLHFLLGVSSATSLEAVWRKRDVPSHVLTLLAIIFCQQFALQYASTLWLKLMLWVYMKLNCFSQAESLWTVHTALKVSQLLSKQ